LTPDTVTFEPFIDFFHDWPATDANIEEFCQATGRSSSSMATSLPGIEAAVANSVAPISRKKVHFAVQNVNVKDFLQSRTTFRPAPRRCASQLFALAKLV
jgi:hypothetical protein